MSTRLHPVNPKHIPPPQNRKNTKNLFSFSPPPKKFPSKIKSFKPSGGKNAFRDPYRPKKKKSNFETKKGKEMTCTPFKIFLFFGRPHPKVPPPSLLPGKYVILFVCVHFIYNTTLYHKGLLGGPPFYYLFEPCEKHCSLTLTILSGKRNLLTSKSEEIMIPILIILYSGTGHRCRVVL